VPTPLSPSRTGRRLLALVVAALLLAPAGAASAAERTGRLLVTLQPHAGVKAASSRALDGARREGAQVPQIGLVSVRPTAGQALGALASALRGRPGILRVEVEHRFEPRLVPDDPSLTALETAPGTPPGTPLQWWIARTGLPAAWDIENGAAATVAVIDSGADSGHPDLVGKISEAIDNDFLPGNGPADGDEDGHGTHVSSIACASGNNATGIVGAGLDCRLIVFKSDLSDGSVARSIVQATDRGVGAINMSFGTDGSAPPSQALLDAIKYAEDRDVVLVAAAANTPDEQNGDPANVLQPTGTAPDITAGRGLTVTAANFFDQRASFAGRGTQISLAAYGAFADGIGPRGLIADFPGNPTRIESGGSLLFPQSPCGCRTQIGGDARFAYLQGTSMAAPMVSAIAALARALNPDVRAAEVIRVLKETATRAPGSGWSPELGWGIVNAGAALNAIRTVDRRAPASKLRGPKRVRRARRVRLTWSGDDKARPKLVASGVARYEVYRSTDRGPYRRIKRTSAQALTVRMAAGSSYRFYTIAVDKAGNRESVPSRPDLSTRVGRSR